MLADDSFKSINFDLIVVGAGPGGATAAWKAAAGGMRVLLLERAPNLPRYKPCGGGIPSSVARAVGGLTPDAFTDLIVTHLRHTWKGKDAVHAALETSDQTPAEIWMVQRPRFDQWLVHQAQQAGAILRTHSKVTEVQIEPDQNGLVRVRTADGSVWHSRLLIGADGAKGSVGARVGLRLGKRWGIAREVEIPFTGGPDNNRWHPALHARTAYLDYGTVKNGYAWIFPKQGCLSVGAGMLLPKQPSGRREAGIGDVLKQAMRTVLGSVGLTLPESDSDAPKIWAHPIPYWTGAEPLATPEGRVLLVGDAAGVVQPLFGEGIQYALRTGDLAARCALSNTITDYTAQVRDLLADEFDAAARVGRVFHQAPYLSYRLGVKNPAGTRLVGRLMAGEATLFDLEQRIYARLKNPLRLSRRRS